MDNSVLEVGFLPQTPPSIGWPRRRPIRFPNKTDVRNYGVWSDKVVPTGEIKGDQGSKMWVSDFVGKED